MGRGRKALVYMGVIGVVVLLYVECCSPLLVYEATHVVVYLIVVYLVIDDGGDVDDRHFAVVVGYLWLGLGLIVFFFHVMAFIVVILVALL